ncbi:MAG: hypothetical protein HY002_08190 [Candidatus Rokubacteria bacterium]|nr:hypothetical protein [Candidatus Rokubacteria bacterium]
MRSDRERGPERADGRRPPVIAALVLACALAPVLQAASLGGLRVLNFAPDRPWNYVAYGLAAPYVALLLWRRHPRARFAAYVFLTHEALRGLHFRRWDAVLVAAGWILLVQLPSARRWAPSLQPAEIIARLRRSPRRP